MSEENLAPQLSPEEIIKMGEEIYEKNLKDKLEPQMAGKFVAIEVESGKDYVENTKEEALDGAKKDFPNKIFFVRRIWELERISSLRFSDPATQDWLYL